MSVGASEIPAEYLFVRWKQDLQALSNRSYFIGIGVLGARNVIQTVRLIAVGSE